MCHTSNSIDYNQTDKIFNISHVTMDTKFKQLSSTSFNHGIPVRTEFSTDFEINVVGHDHAKMQTDFSLLPTALAT